MIIKSGFTRLSITVLELVSWDFFDMQPDFINIVNLRFLLLRTGERKDEQDQN
jgi:hypothetical protein